MATVAKKPWTLFLRATATFAILIPLAIAPGCRAQDDIRRSDRFPYALASPDTTFELPGRLKEISGLTVFDDSTLAAVQDEVGKVYLIDTRSGDVRDEWRFRKNGDYEGVERVGRSLFVLRSDGTLYEITDWHRDSPRVDKHDTPLSSRFDTEGLAYDSTNNRLLIACKEYPGKGLSGMRSLYAFDLNTQQLDPVPVFAVATSDVARAVQSAERRGLLGRFLRNRVDLAGIKPSAAAVHPKNGHVVVVSSVARMLFSLKPDGSIAAASRLSEEIVTQPEGIAFMADGTLFLASEGSNRGSLVRFSYQNQY